MSPEIEKRLSRLEWRRSELKSAGNYRAAIPLQLEIIELLSETGVSRQPDLVLAHNYASCLYLGAKLHASGEWHARRALELHTGNSDRDREALGAYHINLARLLAAQYEFDEAVIHGDMAAENYASTPWHNPPDDFLLRIIEEVESIRNRTWSDSRE